MALLINPEKNSLIFNQDNFHINTNYMPEIAEALRELKKDKIIHFAIDLPKTPALFVLYQDKLLKETPNLDLRLYHRDKSASLKKALKNFNIQYYDLEEFPN